MPIVFWRKLLCLGLGGVLIGGCGRPASLPQKAPSLREGELPRITVIAGGTESYWNEARRGAEAAGKKLGARIEWKVPDAADPIAMQTALIETAAKTSQGVVLAPLDSTKLMQPVGNAARAGLAVVVFDRDVFTIQNKLSFVHNDDEKNEVLKRSAQGAVIAPDYYQMAYQSVKAILDHRAFKPPPREIKIAPKVLVGKIQKTATTDKHR